MVGTKALVVVVGLGARVVVVSLRASVVVVVGRGALPADCLGARVTLGA